MRIGTAFRTVFLVAIILAACAFASRSLAQSAPTAPTYLDQGLSWTAAIRKNFYSRDQGARVMPLAWKLALTQTNGEPFMADMFARYGYLSFPRFFVFQRALFIVRNIYSTTNAKKFAQDHFRLVCTKCLQ